MAARLAHDPARRWEVAIDAVADGDAFGIDLDDLGDIERAIFLDADVAGIAGNAFLGLRGGGQGAAMTAARASLSIQAGLKSTLGAVWIEASASS